ncbi:RNA-binding motif protein 25-like isoform X1 [Apium graveolens]|uniref:RNA-binding motif protein 25-like isoform X1 n=2 Tax=Apium graveolens TaxID=4045 RepID=UPI003D7B7699
MAEEAPISPEKPQTQDNTTNPTQPTSDNPNPQPDQPDPSQFPNPNLTLPPPPLPYAPPSFRPAAPPVPLPMPPQFSPIPNSSFQPQNHGVQPPGVGPGSGPGGLVYPQQMMRPTYMQMPNGYLPMPPPGISRYPGVYPAMVRPIYPPRPGGIVGINPALVRPPVPGVRGPVIAPVIRPGGIPGVTPAEKPQTTVYVGKIASTVDNDFILSILQLCGPVKSWKRPQDPTSGALKGYGFCEFDSAEGILRAIRLLSKLNIDGQELMLNYNSATKEFLERYVGKKKENIKNSEAVGADAVPETEKAGGSATGSEKGGSSESTQVEPKEENADKKDEDITIFGLVTDEDRVADQEALEKLNGIIEERLKTHPLPPPPPPPPMATDGSGISTTEVQEGLREDDLNVNIVKNADATEVKIEDDMKSANRTPNEHDKLDASSPDRNRKNDRTRDRDRDVKREKERELEKNERDREQERAKKDRERQYKTREDERRYMVRVKDWESREKDKDRLRKQEREREEERAEERKYEIIDQERESDDGYNRKRKHRSSGEDRKRRQREKEDDIADRLKEEEEIAEAKMRAEEVRKKQKQEQEETMRLLSASATKKSEEAILRFDEASAESKEESFDMFSNGDSEHENHMTDRILQNGIGAETCGNSVAAVDTQQNSNAQSRKLGFGLVASGKRTAVPSVFSKEEDEDAQKDKKMRPLVPIDYSNDELQAVQHDPSGGPAHNLAAAAEFAKRITGVNSKEEKTEAEKDRIRRSHDHESHRTKHDSRKETVDRDKDRERGSDKVKVPENRKLLDAKQLIDTIPKTKDELFSYEINWAVYDKNKLHERMRPWISKKITEFLGEEETSLVNYIVSTTQEHVNASEVLDRLQSILDDEAEMFVLKMWRMLIFEIKKVETGLAGRAKV